MWIPGTCTWAPGESAQTCQLVAFLLTLSTMLESSQVLRISRIELQSAKRVESAQLAVGGSLHDVHKQRNSNIHSAEFNPPLEPALQEPFYLLITKRKFGVLRGSAERLSFNPRDVLSKSEDCQFRMVQGEVVVFLEVLPPIQPDTIPYTSIAEDLLSRCPHFRILMIGNTGVGKSSLIKSALGIDDACPAQDRWGESNIETPLYSKSNEHFVLHESNGFELGQNDNLSVVKKFIEGRKNVAVKDQLHAIWLCFQIPMWYYGDRMIQAGMEELLRDKGSILGDIPAIFVFTKYDKLTDEIEGKWVEEGKEFTEEQVGLEAEQYLKQHCVERIQKLTGQSNIHYIAVSSKRDFKDSIKGLAELTLRTICQYFVQKYRIHHGAILHIIGNRLRDGHLKLGTDHTVDVAISLHRSALDLRPAGHPDRSDSLFDLGRCLSNRYDQQAAMSDLEESIKLSRAALELRPPGHCHRAATLEYLANRLRDRFMKLSENADLDEAVALARKAPELYRGGDPGHESSLSTLASLLAARFQNQGDLADLEEAVALRRKILALCPEEHPHRPSLLHDLALCLSDRFDQLAVEADIDEAITLIRSALKLHPQGHRDWAESHKCLAYCQKRITEPTRKIGPEGVRKQVMDVVYNTLEFLPPRLLNTHTGILCDRDALISAFEDSQECKQLLSLTTLGDGIFNAVSTYFKYATLSHRWGKNEPMLRHIEGRVIYDIEPTDGLLKLRSFCATACTHGYTWAWSDTCCIDKNSTVELARAIVSMFSWYRRSALTIVYLADISGDGILSSSAWFTRGWTLQELLAPPRVLFYTQHWSLYMNRPSSNHKNDDIVLNELTYVTGIASHFLTNFKPGLDDARLRLQWASARRTTEPEDIAYSLFGLFNIFLPTIPGESAEHALWRLLAEIVSKSADISVLDWVGEVSPFHSCFPASITSYGNLPPTCHDSELEASLSSTEESMEPLVNSLLMLDPPHFIGNRLRLPCIVYQVTAVQLQLDDSRAQRYVHEVKAEGVIPFKITLTSKLTMTSSYLLQYVLIRPWHSKLLASSTKANSTALGKLATMLGQPFSALLLEEHSRNEYKRIASSSVIVVHPLDATSIILQSKVQTLNIV
ncbi:hypothetical protein V8B97DRAFT_1162800 [Scleroderma yunnanense]